jgi:hypothetical protein
LGPFDAIASDKEYHQHQEYRMQEHPVGAVAGLLGLQVYSTASERLKDENQDHKDEGCAQIEHAPPLGPRSSIFHERGDDREHPRN